MITVIKHGDRKAFMATCQECGCVFSLNETDASHSCECTDDHRIIRCPECHAPVEVEMK